MHGAYIMYVSQAIPLIDTAREEKSPFQTETILFRIPLQRKPL